MLFSRVLLAAAAFSTAAVAVAHDDLLLARDGTLQADWQSGGTDLCGVYDARVALLSDGIYFMGGRYTFANGTGNQTQASLYLLSLNQSFALDGNLKGAAIHYTRALPESPYKGDGGCFLYDASTLYFYAGLEEAYKVDGLWGYDLSDNFWKPIGVGGGNFQVGIRRDGMYASNPTTGLSFFSGGSDTAVSGMIILDTSDHASRQWSNDTSFGKSTSNFDLPGPQRMGGESVFLPYGAKGVLLYIGGLDVSKAGTGSNAWDTVGLDLIDIYDVDSKSWYRIEATGDIPSDRINFCYWLSSPQDRTSYQITIYGGYNQDSKATLSDVYVLTVPGFQWVNMGTTTSNGRRGHRCATWRESFGFLIGGLGSSGTTTADADTCDDKFPPVRLLNLSSMSWQDNFDDSYVPAYSIPQKVVSVIGGDSTGGATKKSPEKGWSSDAIASIFGGVNADVAGPTESGFGGTAPTASSTGSASTSSGSAGTGSSSSGSKTNVGAIAGGTAGGIVAIVLIVALILLVRRNRKLQAAMRSQQPSAPTYYEMDNSKEHPTPQTELWAGPQDVKESEMDAQNNSVYELSGHGRERNSPRTPQEMPMAHTPAVAENYR